LDRTARRLPADLARFWEITLEFLKIATAFWPAHLAERGLMDPGARRDALIRREAARLGANGSPGPVIAAGSTGSVPATAALLSAIARLPNGAVVLPGLDQTLDEESWAEIGPSDREPAGAGHPQYGLKLLLNLLGTRRQDVRQLCEAGGNLQRRSWLVSEAMRPAGTTDRWSDSPSVEPEHRAEALGRVGIVEAANEREEVLAVAVLLREAAERPGEVAALVTPDRGLARRVAVELRRWGIDVDDSAGRPLGLTPAGVFSRLIAQTALDGAQPETVLALLKHPLARFGLPQAETRQAARALERAVLRGPRLRPGLDAIRQGIDRLMRERAAEAAEGKWNRPSEAARNLKAEEWTAASDLVARLQGALQPLEALAATPSIPLRSLVEAHAAAVQEASRDESGLPALGGDEAGEALLRAIAELSDAAGAGPDIPPGAYPDFFTAMIDGIAVRRRGGLDPRIHIWGALEARLQSVDTVILGGMNEGTWPSQTRLDPLLSRPMRTALQLEPPERRIGLAAHDFTQALGHPTVWLARADRENGEPRVASRWLQRLTAFAGPDLAAAMRERGAEKLALARILDAPRRTEAPVRPCPVPPLELRPAKLSVTRIEALIRDPYAIYASYF
jgi:ATP-dependent helicase/nuclease subunit B